MRDSIFCKCSEFNQESIKTTFLGCDETNGRFGDVSTRQCSGCNEMWVVYFVEYEGFSQSGRWFMGRVSPSDGPSLTAENTVEYLGRLDKYFYGGSYYKSTGVWGNGKPQVDY